MSDEPDIIRPIFLHVDGTEVSALAVAKRWGVDCRVCRVNDRNHTVVLKAEQRDYPMIRAWWLNPDSDTMLRRTSGTGW